MKNLSLATMVAAALGLGGCASIIHRTTQDVGWSSTPTNAVIAIDGLQYGRTPRTTKWWRNKNHTVRFELNGYLPYQATLTRNTSGWVVGNLVVGGPIGLAVDAIDGAIYNLEPTYLQAEMRKQGLAWNHDALYMAAVLLQPDPTWKRIGSLTKLPPLAYAR